MKIMRYLVCTILAVLLLSSFAHAGYIFRYNGQTGRMDLVDSVAGVTFVGSDGTSGSTEIGNFTFDVGSGVSISVGGAKIYVAITGEAISGSGATTFIVDGGASVIAPTVDVSGDGTAVALFIAGGANVKTEANSGGTVTIKTDFGPSSIAGVSVTQDSVFSPASGTSEHITNLLSDYLAHIAFTGISDYAVDSQVSEYVQKLINTYTDLAAWAGITDFAVDSQVSEFVVDQLTARSQNISGTSIVDSGITDGHISWQSGLTFPRVVEFLGSGGSDFFIVHTGATPILVSRESVLEAINPAFVNDWSLLVVNGSGKLQALDLTLSNGLVLTGQGLAMPIWAAGGGGGGTGGTGATSFRSNDSTVAVAAQLSGAMSVFFLGKQGITTTASGTTFIILANDLHGQVTAWGLARDSILSSITEAVTTWTNADVFTGISDWALDSEVSTYVINQISTWLAASAFQGVTDFALDAAVSEFVVTQDTARTNAAAFNVAGGETNFALNTELTAAGGNDSVTGASIIANAVGNSELSWYSGITLDFLSQLGGGGGTSDFFIVFAGSGTTPRIVGGTSLREAISSAFADPDSMIWINTSGNPQVIDTSGEDGEYLRNNAGIPTWETPSGNVASGTSGLGGAYNEAGTGIIANQNIWTGLGDSGAGSSTYFRSASGVTFMVIGDAGLNLLIAQVTGLTQYMAGGGGTYGINPTPSSNTPFLSGGDSSNSGWVLTLNQYGHGYFTNSLVSVSSMKDLSDEDTYLGPGAVGGVSLAEHYPTWSEHNDQLAAAAFRASTGGTNFAEASGTSAHVAKQLSDYTAWSAFDSSSVTNFATATGTSTHIVNQLTLWTAANAVGGVSLAQSSVSDFQMDFVSGASLARVKIIIDASGSTDAFLVCGAGTTPYWTDAIGALEALDSDFTTPNRVFYTDGSGILQAKAIDADSTGKYLESLGVNNGVQWSTPEGGTGGAGVSNFIVRRLDGTQDAALITGSSVYFAAASGISLTVTPTGSQTGATIYIGSGVSNAYLTGSATTATMTEADLLEPGIYYIEGTTAQIIALPNLSSVSDWRKTFLAPDKAGVSFYCPDGIMLDGQSSVWAFWNGDVANRGVELANFRSGSSEYVVIVNEIVGRGGTLDTGATIYATN